MSNKTLTPEHKHKIRLSKLAERNPMWRGDSIGLAALHWWVRRRLPMADKCQMCFVGPAYDLANVTGVYTRDLSNWSYICRKCHMKSDGRLVARDKKTGRWVSPKRVKVYSVFRRQGVTLNPRIYPNIFASSSGELT